MAARARNEPGEALDMAALYGSVAGDAGDGAEDEVLGWEAAEASA